MSSLRSPPLSLYSLEYFFMNRDSVSAEAPKAPPAPESGPETAAAPGGATVSAKPEKKRRRPALSCEQCRKRKIRCDRSVPCANCARAKISPCTYAPTHIPASRSKKVANREVERHQNRPPFEAPLRPAPGKDNDIGNVLPSGHILNAAAPIPVKQTSSVPSSIGGSTSEASNVDALLARIRHLEQKLEDTVHISRSGEDRIKEKDAEPSAVMKGTVSKTRFFGQSHWMNGADLFPNIFRILQQAESLKIAPYGTFVQCKNIGRTIKEHRHEPLSSSNLGKTVPRRELADQLVDIYFSTVEGVLRILHGPTFRAECERYWQNPSAANDAFVMQLQLCMAVGATMYDDLFSLRRMAVQWVHEAQIWLLLPPEKSKMTIAGIQIMCMLIIAKATCAVGQELTWVTTGSLLRQAMYMGLHRDPRHLADMSVYRAEVRRRLWATILELNLQSAYDAGGPPLISSQQYDTQPPADLNDDELSDEPESSHSLPSPPGPDRLTDTSVQLSLFKSFPLRLSIIKHVNEFAASDSYTETLRLNSDLNKACRTMAERLASLAATQKSHPSRSVLTSFHSSLAQLFVYRCFISLHQPMIARSINDPTYYYSRKVCLDCSLKMAHICGLSAPRHPSAPAGPPADAGVAFDRIITNGSGVFRIVPVQTTFSIALELVKKKEEQQESLGGLPSMGCSELRSALEASFTWAERRIRSGETNIKGHCFIGAALALVDAIEMDLPQEQSDQMVVDTAGTLCGKALDMLKELAEREGVNVTEETGEVDMEGVGSMESLMDMPFDWIHEDFGWNEIGMMM